MAQPILIKRSNITSTPASLLEGELAYSTLSKNLFIGTNGGANIEVIGGYTDHAKLAGIQSGAQVNTVNLGANTFVGKQTFIAPSTSTASVTIPNGLFDPSVPASGDFWANAGLLKWYNGTTLKVLAFTDSNITGTASNVTGTIAVANGGTGLTSYTVGDLLVASGSTVINKLSDVATGNVLLSGGTGVVPSYGKVDLTTHITGTLTTGNGGTGSNTQTANKLVTTDASGNLVSSSSVSSTEAGYLSGVTSPIQTQINTKATTASPTFTGVVTLSQDPINPLEAATKQYVDGIAQGLDFKNSVSASTTANIVLSGLQTVDTVSLVAGDRILVKNQSTTSQNGLYVVSTGAWARSTDADTSAEVTTGMFVFVEKGSQGGTSWVLTTQGSITLNSTGLSFTQFGAGSAYTAGSGIDITSTTISLASAGFSASYITSGTLSDSRLSNNVIMITSTIDGGSF
jgi:hypothetical protein